MAEAGAGLPSVFVAGANQRTASLSLRDRLFVEEGRVPAVLTRLHEAAIPEALLLATCDRVEVVGMAADPLAAADRALDALADEAALTRTDLAGQVYRLAGKAAVRHVFRVAASLELTVIGEPHILAQIKGSLQASRVCGCCGAGLETLIQAALATGKRARSETGVGRRPVSAAAAAIERAKGVHGDLATVSALVVGMGEMGELIATALQGAGLVRISVTHPRAGRAEAAARALGAHVVPFADLADALAGTDIVVGSLGARQPAITYDAMRAALKRRRQRPILVLDVAVPADVDPAVDRLEAAFLYTFDDLERLAEDGRQSRAAAAAAAAALVDEAIAGYLSDRVERLAVPILTRLRERFEAQRLAALGDAGGDADKATRLLVNRLLHLPTRALRRMATAAGDDPQTELARLEALLQRLFDAGEEDDERR